MIADENSIFADATVRALSNIVAYKRPPEEVARMQRESDLKKLGINEMLRKNRNQIEDIWGLGTEVEARNKDEPKGATWIQWNRKVDKREYEIKIGFVDGNAKSISTRLLK